MKLRRMKIITMIVGIILLILTLVSFYFIMQTSTQPSCCTNPSYSFEGLSFSLILVADTIYLLFIVMGDAVEDEKGG